MNLTLDSFAVGDPLMTAVPYVLQ